MYIYVCANIKAGRQLQTFLPPPSAAYNFHPTQISLKRLVQYSSASQSQSIWGWVYVRDEGGGSSPSICTIQNSWQLLYTVPAVSVQSQPCTVWGGSHLHSEKPSCFFSLCLPCRSSIADESVFLFIFIFFPLSYYYGTNEAQASMACHPLLKCVATTTAPSLFIPCLQSENKSRLLALCTVNQMFTHPIYKWWRLKVSICAYEGEGCLHGRYICIK